MQPDFGHYVAALVVLIVLVFGTDYVFWIPRRHSPTWRMRGWRIRGLEIGWSAGVFSAYAVALYGFKPPVLLVRATGGAILGMMDAVPWKRLFSRQRTRDHVQ